MNSLRLGSDKVCHILAATKFVTFWLRQKCVTFRWRQSLSHLDFSASNLWISDFWDFVEFELLKRTLKRVFGGFGGDGAASNLWLQKSASIQKRTRPLKFDHFR